MKKNKNSQQAKHQTLNLRERDREYRQIYVPSKKQKYREEYVRVEVGSKTLYMNLKRKVYDDCILSVNTGNKEPLSKHSTLPTMHAQQAIE